MQQIVATEQRVHSTDFPITHFPSGIKGQQNAKICHFLNNIIISFYFSQLYFVVVEISAVSR